MWSGAKSAQGQDEKVPSNFDHSDESSVLLTKPETEFYKRVTLGLALSFAWTRYEGSYLVHVHVLSIASLLSTGE